MNTIEAINSRRSCKNFDPKKLVPTELIQKICDAGTKAASGKNRQAAKIIVVNNKIERNLISKKNAEILGAINTDPFYGAPQIVCVVADKSIFTYLYDGALVMGNMMLAAEELGIASCWIHRAKEFFDMPEGKSLLKHAGLDGNFEGIGNLAIGYPNGNKRDVPKISENYITWLN